MTSATVPTAVSARTRCSWSPEERAEWIRLLEQSGQTLSEFCRQNDLPESTVSLWRRQLRGLRTEPADDGAFLEVPGAAMPAAMAGGVASSAALVVRLPGDIHLELAAGTDAVWLADLLRALQGS